MKPLRSALYLDFDNVFSGLAKLDPRSAMNFAERPERWLGRLSTDVADGPRRWLVLRCYMNPAGWIPNPVDEKSRLYFSKFRPRFTDAGFEVVDCPRLTHSKNGADIRLVVDALEAMRSEVRYEEFVIASSDSDMTALLVRLRASDRSTTLLSASDSAVVLGAVADRLVGGEEIVELVSDGNEISDGVDSVESSLSNPLLSEEDGKTKFHEQVTQHYVRATEPLNLATLAHEMHIELGPVVTQSRWFGHGGFARALRALELPGMMISQHHLWDSRRHTPPRGDEGQAQGEPQVPEAVRRVSTLLKLPILDSETWRQVCDALATFCAAHEFNLTEATRWCRDYLAGRGVRVKRQTIATVVYGATYGGCPLYREPPPASEEITAAFIRNVLDRVSGSDVDLSPEEVDELRAWFQAA